MNMIFLECNNDEFLIKSLGFSRKQIFHVYNKGDSNSAGNYRSISPTPVGGKLLASSMSVEHRESQSVY